MKNAFNNKLLGRVAVFAVAGAVAVGQFAGFFRNNAVVAQAEEISEIIYYGDTIYGDAAYAGEGVSTDSSYWIDCDEVVIESYSIHPSVPSFGNSDTTMRNICGPITGTNIMGFYDRWYSNLIPNYTPGYTWTNGFYEYFLEMVCLKRIMLLEDCMI